MASLPVFRQTFGYPSLLSLIPYLQEPIVQQKLDLSEEPNFCTLKRGFPLF